MAYLRASAMAHAAFTLPNLQSKFRGAAKREAFQSSFGTSESIAFQKLAQYFETHYKYTYAIRTAQDLKLEYLRLPQSSIQKNE